MSDARTAFMKARSAFHSTRTADAAKVYADAALKANKGSGVCDAVAEELKHAGFADEAKRVRSK